MANLDPTCITIVSKSRLFRDGLKSLLNETKFRTVCEVEEVHQIPADGGGSHAEELILLDAGVNYPNLVDDVRHVNGVLNGVPLIILADVLEPQLLVECMAVGACGYLLKDISTDALVSSLRLVQSGEKVFPTHMAALLLRGSHRFVNGHGEARELRGMSNRERQILCCLIDGESNKSIARRLRVTEATIKVHMKSLMRKIGCRNRTQAAIWAINHGVNGPVEPPSQRDSRHDYDYESHGLA